ncbi:unnamed protein product, partial [Nesidiocoris tenuis]
MRVGIAEEKYTLLMTITNRLNCTILEDGAITAQMHADRRKRRPYPASPSGSRSRKVVDNHVLYGPFFRPPSPPSAASGRSKNMSVERIISLIIRCWLHQ